MVDDTNENGAPNFLGALEALRLPLPIDITCASRLFCWLQVSFYIHSHVWNAQDFNELILYTIENEMLAFW